MEPIYPRALRRGDTIGLIAPASTPKRARIEKASEHLAEMGFHVKCYRDLYQEHGYLAGDDATRAAELMSAFADPEVSAIFPARGGTGITRILGLLDYQIIRKHPKVFVGYSDNTALHLALQSQTGLVTFHGPHPMDGLGAAEGLSELSARTYWRAFQHEQYFDEGGAEQPNGYLVPLTENEQASLTTLHPGTARGRLVGGNLALIVALMGTPYEINTAGNILLLEDINEPPYRIDRLLSQLQLAGKLDELAGILLGQFTKCEAPQGDVSLTVAEIFQTYFGNLNIPVLQNFPTGHSRDNVTLPLNVAVELNAYKRTVQVLSNPVEIGS